MRQLMNLFAAVLLGTQFLAAQAPPDWTLGVDLTISGDNGALKSEVQSYVSQELHALNRGVKITAVNPDYRLRVGTVRLGDGTGGPAGLVVSYVYSRIEKVPANPIFGPEPDRELLRSSLVMLSGAKGEERSICHTIVAAFDAAVLKQDRAMRDAIRQQVRERKN